MDTANPKDACGVLKVSLSYVPAPVIAELALGMQEGGLKYGRHNYRVVPVRASIYYDATMRHMMDWWEGTDIDAESGAKLHHVTKAIASLVVLRDAMMQGTLIDDRPPRSPEGWLQQMNVESGALSSRYPQPAKPVTHVDASWAKAANEPTRSVEDAARQVTDDEPDVPGRITTLELTGQLPPVMVDRRNPYGWGRD